MIKQAILVILIILVNVSVASPYTVAERFENATAGNYSWDYEKWTVYCETDATVDCDYSTGSITGAPWYWGDYAMRCATSAATGNACLWTNDEWTGDSSYWLYGEWYYSMGVIFSAWDGAAAWTRTINYMAGGPTGSVVNQSRMYVTRVTPGGTYKLQIYIHTGEAELVVDALSPFNSISLDTEYRIEVHYDPVGLVWDWKINETYQPNNNWDGTGTYESGSLTSSCQPYVGGTGGWIDIGNCMMFGGSGNLTTNHGYFFVSTDGWIGKINSHIQDGFESTGTTGYGATDHDADNYVEWVAGAGSSLDPDHSTSSVTGAPVGWGDDCLKADVGVSGGYSGMNKPVRSAGYEIYDHYFHMEFLVGSDSLSTNDKFELAWIGSFGKPQYFLYVEKTATNTYQIHNDCTYHPTTTSVKDALTTFSQGEMVTLDVRWDDTINEWGWLVDGVFQPNNNWNGTGTYQPGTLEAGHTGVKSTTQYIGPAGSYYTGGPVIVYIDNVSFSSVPSSSVWSDGLLRFWDDSQNAYSGYYKTFQEWYYQIGDVSENDYLCGQGGTFYGKMIMPSSGTIGNPIKFMRIKTGGFSDGGNDYITIENCISINALSDGVSISGTGNSVFNSNIINSNTYDFNIDSPATVQNCIMSGGASGNMDVAGGQAVVGGYNCFHDEAHPSADYTDTGSSDLDSTDPLFVSTTDFHLKAGSPCIGKADDGGDIGAYPFAGHGLGSTDLNTFLGL